jgi:hypothetical protein
VKRYQVPAVTRFLIYIPWHFPLHKDATIKGASIEAERVFEKEYPAIYGHLCSFKTELQNRNKAETGIRYEWYALQRWASDYYQEIPKPKIIIPAIIQRPSMALDDNGVFSNDKTTIVISDSKLLLGILNSEITNFIMQKITSTKQGGFFEYKPVYISQIPIPTASDAQKEAIEGLVTQILAAKQTNPQSDTSALEAEVDALVYGLYGLTEEEIGIVEGR